jgi:hypothetical protein
MATRDLHNHIKVVLAIAPVVVTDNTAQVSAIIDTAGYESAELVINTGVLADADATFAVAMTEGNDSALADGAAVAAADYLGTLASTGFTFAADSVSMKLGYRGGKRYLKATITPAANTGNAPLSATWVLSHPRHQPVA